MTNTPFNPGATFFCAARKKTLTYADCIEDYVSETSRQWSGWKKDIRPATAPPCYECPIGRRNRALYSRS